MQFLVFFPTHTLLTLSAQPFTSHHFTTHINFFHKVSFLPPSLHCTSLHFQMIFTSFYFASVHFQMISNTLYLPLTHLDFHFPYPLFKNNIMSACQQADSTICLTNACCCRYSLERLIMDGKTVRNMYSVIPK